MSTPKNTPHSHYEFPKCNLKSARSEAITSSLSMRTEQKLMIVDQ